MGEGEISMANMNITRRVIREAFLELLNEKALGKITVKDITDRCGINRNTFYYHYQDIPALVEEICAMTVDRIVQEYPTLNSLEECLDASMKFMMEYKRAIMHIYNSDNRNTYVSFLWRVCEYTISTYVNTVFADSELAEEDRALIIRYHKCECFGMILDWISTGMKEEYLYGIRRICWLKKGSTEALIQRSRERMILH